ncbi:MAG: TusE/DsrC/DsvC family sulfur relay protein [Gammaproteobacteria bacterium]|nr:TusE/DsrC/DsvC family sulfur relay protein [Gammaproteobacteria bacterium]
MAVINVSGRDIPVDQEGFLTDLTDWDRDVAQALAVEEGVTLDARHWEIIDFLRAYYAEYQLTPALRILTRKIGLALGKDKGNVEYLLSLFPVGPLKQACKFSGLPKPTGCV